MHTYMYTQAQAYKQAHAQMHTKRDVFEFVMHYSADTNSSISIWANKQQYLAFKMFTSTQA